MSADYDSKEGQSSSTKTTHIEHWRMARNARIVSWHGKISGSRPRLCGMLMIYDPAVRRTRWSRCLPGHSFIPARLCKIPTGSADTAVDRAACDAG